MSFHHGSFKGFLTIFFLPLLHGTPFLSLLINLAIKLSGLGDSAEPQLLSLGGAL